MPALSSSRVCVRTNEGAVRSKQWRPVGHQTGVGRLGRAAADDHGEPVRVPLVGAPGGRLRVTADLAVFDQAHVNMGCLAGAVPLAAVGKLVCIRMMATDCGPRR